VHTFAAICCEELTYFARVANKGRARIKKKEHEGKTM